MKKTWKTIDETLNRGKNETNFLSELSVDHKLIADNVFFATIGAKLSAGNNQINCAQSYSDYLNNPTPHRFTLSTIDESYILSIINKLNTNCLEMMRYKQTI